MMKPMCFTVLLKEWEKEMNSWEITVSYQYSDEGDVYHAGDIYVGQTDIDAINDMLDYYSRTDRKVIKVDEICEWEGV